jgi:hypothetical protein
MTEISAGDVPTKLATLPFLLVPTPASRRASTRKLLLGALVVSVFVAGVTYLISRNGLWAIGIGVVTLLLISALILRAISRANDPAFPRGSVGVGARHVRCRALVEGEFGWDALTSFRWVLQDKTHSAVFERGDGQSTSGSIRAKEFVVEAAETRDTEQTNEFGYYDRAAIQFDLDDLCLKPPSRRDADAVLALLNGLQEAAAAGRLRDGDAVQIPAFLNAVPVPESVPDRSARQATIVRP